MTVNNREKNAIPSSLTPEQFGQHMNMLNLDDIPPERRKMAIIDHMMRVAAGNITDPMAAAELSQAWLSRKAKR